MTYVTYISTTVGRYSVNNMAILYIYLYILCRFIVLIKT